MQSERIVEHCRRALERDGLFGALHTLNGSADFRYTGIYRFDGRWMKNVWLVDRQLPRIEFGSDILWDDSYCRIAAADGDTCVVSDALHDARLLEHSARGAVQSYAAVVLRAGDGEFFGTLCQYDVVPRPVVPALIESMRAVRPLFEEALHREMALGTGPHASLLRGHP